MRDTQVPRTRILSEAEIAVLRAIRDFIKEKGVSPTYDEIARKSKRNRSTNRKVLDRLTKLGLLSRTPYRERFLVVTEEGLKAAGNGRRKR